MGTIVEFYKRFNITAAMRAQRFGGISMKFLFIALLFMIIGGVIASIVSRYFAQRKATGALQPPKADLELIYHQPLNINFFKYVAGTIRNNTNKTYEQVRVQINVYANKGELMGNTSASTVNLKPGECWEFQAPILEQGEFSYKFTGITGY